MEEPRFDRPVRLVLAAYTVVVAGVAAVYAVKFIARGELIHLGVTFLLGVGVLVLLTLQSRTTVARQHAVLVLLSITVSLYIAEFALSSSLAVLDVHELRAAKAQEAGVPFDTRGRVEVVLANRTSGEEWFTTVSPRHFLSDTQQRLRINERQVVPFGGIAETNVVNCNESGEFATFTSDEYGFNNPLGIWSKREPIDAVFVGDSYTVGSCVASGQNFVDLVRRMWQRTLNLGSTGNGPLSQLGGLREYLQGREVRYVFWVYYEGNDLADYDRERHEALLVKYLDPDFSQGLVHIQSDIDAALRELVDRWLRAPLAHEGTPTGLPQWVAKQLAPTNVQKLLFRVRKAVLRPDPVPYDLDLYGRVLRAAKAETAKYGGKLVVVYLPEYHRFAPSFGTTSGAHLKSEFIESVRSLGIDVIDVAEAFAMQPEPLTLFPYGVFGHYNSEGHALVARVTLDYMAR